MFEVRLLSQPEKYFKRAPVPLAKRLAQCFLTLERDPFIPTHAKKLKGKAFAGLYRYRLGDIRVIFSVDIDHKIVLIQTILPRGDVYKR